MKISDILFLSILMLFGCSDSTEDILLSEQDLVPNSTYEIKNSDSSSVTNKAEKSGQVLSYLEQFQDSIHTIRIENEPTYFPDRLSFLKKEHFYVNYNQFHTEFSIWEFEDSLTTANALFNWLDCFGNECYEIGVGNQIKVSNNSIFIMMSNYHLIYLMDSSDIDFKFWEQQLLTALNLKNSNLQLRQKVDQIANWIFD